jgi:hypothetical protein
MMFWNCRGPNPAWGIAWAKVGKYMGSYEDVVNSSMLHTSVARRSTAADHDAARAMHDAASASHGAYAANLSSGTRAMGEDLKVPDSLVVNGEEAGLASSSAASSAFMRGLYKDMQKKAFDDEGMEADIMGAARERARQELWEGRASVNIWLAMGAGGA